MLQTPREKHARPGHVLAIPVAELVHHPPLFVPCQKVVKGDHDHPQDNGEKPRPQDCQPQSGGSQGQVLRVANPTVEPTEGRVVPKELVEVHLPGADQEDGRSTHEQDRTRNPNRLEEKPGGQDHMGQEERRQPARGRPMGEPEQDGIEGRVKERRKGADHNQHLKGDDEVQDDGGPEEST